MPWSPPTHTYLHQRIAKAKRQETRRQQHREYNKDRAPEDRIYGTQRWKRVRAAQLRREPVCRRCRRELARIVDHVLPVKEGGAWFDPGNLQSLCAACHNAKTAEDKGQKK